NAEIEKHKGPLTRVVDLNRRTVIPGLIDNHAHYMRAAEYWHREVRLDGITSHQEALDLIKHKAAESKPGEWVGVLGARRNRSSGTSRAAWAGQSSMASRRTIRWRSSCSTSGSTPIPRRSRRWESGRPRPIPPASRSRRTTRGS